MTYMPTFSVLIPTWKRPEKLFECLNHIANQIKKPDEVIVIVREIDTESIKIITDFMEQLPELRYVFTTRPGVIAAENVGISEARYDYIAFIDDDGYAPDTWLLHINNFFINNPNATALGGSDIIKGEPWTYHDYEVTEVGLLTWYGKIIGNHHRKCLGPLRKVDVLKGVNMIFKRKSIGSLDEKLAGIEGHLGNGSQWELDLCMRVKNNGGDIYFDPSLVVIHDSNHTTHNHLIASMNNAHNLAYVMLKNLSLVSQLIFLIYALTVGNTQLPGIFKMFYDVIKEKSLKPIQIYFFKLRGFFGGILTYIN
jgi:glycosyltransferase involved in cell wall biosynthesis